MGRGGYNGGSTLIGAGRSWTFDPDFDFKVADKQSSRGKSSPLKVAQKPPAFTIAGQAVSKKVRRKHRLAQLQNVDRDTVLAGLERSLPKKPTERREALKRLVLDKILLQTGAIDIGHPAVAAWLKTGRKKIKNHAR